MRQSSVYFEAREGLIEETSLAFFDAMETLDDEEDDYPIITTAVPPRASIRVTFQEPETLLRAMNEEETIHEEDEFVDAATKAASGSGISDSNGVLERVDSAVRRGSVFVKADLKEPRVSVQERGYPGLLDSRELKECQTFYREIHKRGGALRDIVFAYKDVEDEPYTICRFMRPTKFAAPEMLQRLEQSKAVWEAAAKQKFYPDVEAALGIPTSLLLRFYPFFYQGNAKNGCPVNYFKAGTLHVEGLMSLLSLEHISRYSWHLCTYIFPQMIAEARAKDPNFVRTESINVMDLHGLSSSQVGGEAMDILKQASGVGNFFPETMHCMLILNAPSWFSLTWKIIRGLIDPRTARKIEVYTNSSRGTFRLQQLVEVSQIPSDFGGFGPPTMSLDEGRREALQVLHVNKRGRTVQEVPHLAKVATHEKVESIRVYSRSATGVQLAVQKDGKPLVSKFVIEAPKNSSSGAPYQQDLWSKGTITGPCTISLTAEALQNEKSPPKKVSHGYFVVVVYISNV
jgi:hypothetical protein